VEFNEFILPVVSTERLDLVLEHLDFVDEVVPLGFEIGDAVSVLAEFLIDTVKARLELSALTPLLLNFALIGPKGADLLVEIVASVSGR